MNFLLKVDSHGLSVQLGTNGVSVPFESIKELRGIIAAMILQRGLSADAVTVLCTSSIDFPEEYTDNPEYLELCRQLRDPNQTELLSDEETEPVKQWYTNRTKYFDECADEDFRRDVFSRLYTMIDPGGGRLLTQEQKDRKKRATELADELAEILMGGVPAQGEVYT